MSKNDKREFKFARKVLLKDFEKGASIYSADYTFIQEGVDPAIYQCDLVEREDAKHITFEMKPGVFKLEMTNSGIVVDKIDTQKVDFLETSKTYEEIVRQLEAFFDNLDVYAKLGIAQPRRGLLLHSPPGQGKSAAISRVSEFYAKNKNACVLVWPSDQIKADDLESFLSNNTDWSGVDKLILITEDIGGGHDLYGTQHSKVPAGLLNFLDGINSPFKKPTFIVATTNNPDSLLNSLTSRPGRFDIVMELPPLSAVDRIRFLKFFAKDDYNLKPSEEKDMQELTDGFSIAHLKEVFVRSMLLKKSMLESAKELKLHIKKVKEGLSKKPQGAVGFGADEWDYED